MSIDQVQASRYITELFAMEDPVLTQVREDSSRLGLPPISVNAEEGRFLQFLVRACNAARVVEIGTLGGYSGIWIAQGLAPEGKLITVEREPRHAQIARQHFAAAGLSERVEVWEGEIPAIFPILAERGPFDFIFIDADKHRYPACLSWALENARPGGLIAAHNAWRNGTVLDPNNREELTLLMRDFTRQAAAEGRWLSTIYPGGDGMLVGVKNH